MKIAFLSSLNPYDINNWSGTLYYIFHSLQKTHDVEWIGGGFVEKAKKLHFLQNKDTPFIPALYSSYFAVILSDLFNEKDEYDIIIARDCIFIAYLKVNIPIIYIGDTTFDLIKESWGITNEDIISLSDKIEKKALLNSDSIVFSSKWAKDNAILHYGITPSNIHIIEFGANISKIPDMEDSQIPAMDICNLLFIGKDWNRKGGEKTLEAYKILKKKGLLCSLTIVGHDIKSDQQDSNIQVFPFLDKALEKDAALFNRIMHNTHFLFLPTNFDCFGIVFCEASAYGIPSITADVGGVSQVVKQGKNGYLLSSDATALEYAVLIESTFNNRKEYYNLRLSSRKEFEDRLNWGVWSKKMNMLLKQFEKKEITHNLYPNENECDFYIPTYVINLKNRVDRRKHIEKQFEKKTEFEFNLVEAIPHPIGAVGLWKSMRKTVQIALEQNDEIIILCEDDHTFSNNYSRNLLFRNIIEAEKMGVEILLGGISGFGVAVPTASNLYWIDWYWGNQFIIIFQSLFQRILDYSFKDTDMADLVLSAMTHNKMVMYPFLSIQKEFGYSDINKLNETPGYVNNLFIETDRRLSVVHKINQLYNNRMK
ncbi:MAG: glycosyltransferase [Dysgonamonadaceae bacterium]